MSPFLAGNLFLFGSMVFVTASHIMIKALIDQAMAESLTWNTLGQFLTTGRIVRGGIAGVFLVSGFLAWIVSLTKLDLSYAYPVASTTVLFISLFSVIVLGESLTSRMWIGTGLILFGIILLRPVSG